MRRFVALAFVAVLAACSGNNEQKAPEPFGTRPATEVLRDGVIIAAVKAKLTAVDPDSSTTLGVNSRDGVVTLNGTVRDAAARGKVVAAAQSVPGVKRVVDDVRVNPHGPRPGQQLSDAALTARIVAAYTTQIGLQQHVRVRVDHGVATLDGTVGDAKARDTIDATARGTQGVRNVVDHIRVERP